MKPDCNEVKDSNGSGGVCYGISSASGVCEVNTEGIRAVFIGFMWIMVSIHEWDIKRECLNLWAVN